MSEVNEGGFEDALAALSSLINRRKRADGSNWGDAFALMYKYVEVRDFDGRCDTFTHSPGKGKCQSKVNKFIVAHVRDCFL